MAVVYSYSVTEARVVDQDAGGDWLEWLPTGLLGSWLVGLVAAVLAVFGVTRQPRRPARRHPRPGPP